MASIIAWFSKTVVPDWRAAWKWFSVQCMALDVAIIAAWGGLSPDLRSAIPAKYVLGVAAAVLVLGIVGRFIKQGPPNA